MIAGIAELLCRVCWPIWLVSAMVVAGRVIMRDRTAAALRTTSLVVLIGCSVSTFVLAYRVPLPSYIDPTFVISTLWSGHYEGAWKGLAGSGLVNLLAGIGMPWPPETRELRAISLFRALNLLLPVVALALACQMATPASPAAPDDGAEPRRGAFAALVSLVLCALLVFSPQLVFGVASARYFGYIPLVVGTTLVSQQEWLEKRDPWALTSLAAGLPLLAWSRPDAPLVTVVIAGIICAQWWWQRRRFDAPPPTANAVRAGFFVAVACIVVTLPSVVIFLGDSLRFDRIALGDDAMGEGSFWTMIPSLARRSVENMLHTLWIQSGATCGLAVVALLRVVQAGVRRDAAPAEWLAAAWLVGYGVILSVHEEGATHLLTWLTKYGMILVVPVWYLAGRQLVLSRSKIWTTVVLVVVTGITIWFDADHVRQASDLRPHTTRLAELRLEVLPQTAAQVCLASPTEDPCVVIVVRTSDHPDLRDRVGPEGAVSLSARGCQARSVTLDDPLAALCAGLPPNPGHPGDGHVEDCDPTWALFLFSDGATHAEVDGFVDGAESCGWEHADAWSPGALIRRPTATSGGSPGPPADSR